SSTSISPISCSCGWCRNAAAMSPGLAPPTGSGRPTSPAADHQPPPPPPPPPPPEPPPPEKPDPEDEEGCAAIIAALMPEATAATEFEKPALEDDQSEPVYQPGR